MPPGATATPRASLVHAGVYYVGLIFVASLALEQRRIYLATAIAVAFETALMFLGRKRPRAGDVPGSRGRGCSRGRR
jgi:hypothetical protein